MRTDLKQYDRNWKLLIILSAFAAYMVPGFTSSHLFVFIFSITMNTIKNNNVVIKWGLLSSKSKRCTGVSTFPPTSEILFPEVFYEYCISRVNSVNTIDSKAS